MASYLTKSVNAELCEFRFAFRPGRQVLDEVFTLRQAVEKTNEWEEPMCPAKKDVLKAYDLLNTNVVIEALQHPRKHYPSHNLRMASTTATFYMEFIDHSGSTSQQRPTST